MTERNISARMEFRTYELTKKEWELIEDIRAIPYGRLVVVIQKSQPHRTEEGIKSKVLGLKN